MSATPTGRRSPMSISRGKPDGAPTATFIQSSYLHQREAGSAAAFQKSEAHRRRKVE
jgi:hypothetical protein